MPANDLSIYSDFANEWWIPGAPRFRSLQNLTPFRLSLIEEHCGNLRGRDVVDLGCGGGLIAVPLLTSGACVVGVDQSEASIAVARRQAEERGTFLVADIHNVPLPSCSADAVLLVDVLDHIPDYPVVLAEAARLARPGGTVFVGTINRTLLARIFAIYLGEGLRLIPPGTHDYRLFIRPSELEAAARNCGLLTIGKTGEWPTIVRTLGNGAITLRRSRSLLIAYSMAFRKI